MKKTEVIIIGVGRFAEALISELSRFPRFTLIAIDSDIKKLAEISTNVDKTFVGDASNEQFLKEIGIKNADIFVVSIGNDIQSNLLTSSILKDNFNGTVIAKAVSKRHAAILKKIGVNIVIMSDTIAARRTAISILNPILSLELSERNSELTELDGGVSILTIEALPVWENKMIKDLKIPRSISIVLIRRDKKVVIVNGLTKIEKNDRISIVGSNEELSKMLKN
ncbi:/ ktrA / Ktr system potassium uptake protein A /:602029 Forward [Candidatus Hepatoplasma crinochetorum]|uniref:/ ktrA / Ktr system potassium uptake protein A /:602029 Forward n=1 Tax=Candidatus Hepatoplasma crinochetorum TaxID=295596 RepID=A0A0G7ZN52_9MOLU|nr:/ ktrA / Ktr system potassium uptake protein A /:602029 Forward [Candidatus Hepatoplasma crinochetorum]